MRLNRLLCAALGTLILFALAGASTLFSTTQVQYTTTGHTLIVVSNFGEVMPGDNNIVYLPPAMTNIGAIRSYKRLDMTTGGEDLPSPIFITADAPPRPSGEAGEPGQIDGCPQPIQLNNRDTISFQSVGSGWVILSRYVAQEVKESGAAQHWWGMKAERSGKRQ